MTGFVVPPGHLGMYHTTNATAATANNSARCREAATRQGASARVRRNPPHRLLLHATFGPRTMNPMHGLLADIGIAILAATFLGLLAHWLRQPVILGYLIAGAIVGHRIGLSLIEPENIETISEIGLVLLLFIIGLELNLKQILAASKQLLVVGFGQFPICAVLGVALFWLMGYGLKGTSADGLYLALTCGLSSTAIVVKVLYDKGELDTLAGRLTLGILVIQDIYAIFILAFQPNFAQPRLFPIAQALLATFGLLTGGFLYSRYILGRLLLSVARSPEMVVAISLGWCAAVAGLAGWMGLSKEMGALVAGLSISAFPYSVHVTAKTLPLRDFFLTLFFVSLGMKIEPPTWAMFWPLAAVILFVIVSRFLSVYPLAKLSGAGPRAALIGTINTAQISEFSLVIAALGVTPFGHITRQTQVLIIYAMAVLAVVSSYMIRYNHQLYLAFNRLKAALGLPPAPEEDGDTAAHEQRPIAILGYHRAARALVDALERTAPEILKQILVVDFNTEVLHEVRARGMAGVFGDISSLDTLDHVHLGSARLILCTIPDMLLKGTDNINLVRTCHAVAPRAMIVATADDAEHERRLRTEGAAFVVQPHMLVGEHLAAWVRETFSARDSA